MRNLSKSKLLAFRQCAKRLWLEVHRPDLQVLAADTEAQFQIGRAVGQIARRLYDPAGSGVLVRTETEKLDQAIARSTDSLHLWVPLFEAGFAADGALAFADIMLPVGTEPKHAWRMVEVKSSTSVKDYHRDDVAIQAFVAKGAGVPLEAIALAHIDGDWIYPGGEDYRGLLKEHDLTDEASERADEVRGWIETAHATVANKSEPEIRTGRQCSDPYDCGFSEYCRAQEPQAEYPVDWLPHLRRRKALKNLVEQNSIIDMRDIPDEYLDSQQQLVKKHTLSGEPFFDPAKAAAELAHYCPPAYFLDFETIQFAVPMWKGTRPYQQIPFQFSCHCLSTTSEITHSEFLDLTGDDPSEPFAEALIRACGQSGPIFVYNASFEASRIKELAERFPRHNPTLMSIHARIIDLLPIAREYYYHPCQHGSWSLKSVLPTIASDLRYDELDGVQDGSMAMAAYIAAINKTTAESRRDELRVQLLAYCKLDTFALVRLWQYFARVDSRN